MSRLPAGQHQWETTFERDELTRPIPPRRQALVFVAVTAPPTAEAVQQLETALSVLESQYSYGPDGLLSTVGWGTQWWTEFTDHPALLAAPSRMSRWEDPVLDTPHAVFHLASNHEDVVDTAIDALFGTGPSAQGEFLKVQQVRRGFVGAGLAAEALPELGLPQSAPLLFGFHSIHRGNQATEESITITEGPLTAGTFAHVSRIVLDVQRWHAKTRDEQAGLLYAPTITAAAAEVLQDDAPSDYRRAYPLLRG